MRRRDFLAAASLISALPAALSIKPAFADYPTRPIRLIVPRQPGGVVDLVGRRWAHGVTPKLGSIYVENVGGGGGTIGTGLAARAEPDGYSLLMGATSDIVLNPLQRKLTYDTERDLTSIAVIAESVGAIAINPKLPIKSLKELVAYCNSEKEKMSYASAGAGTMSNLIGELFKKQAGLPKLVHVPYKSGAGGFSDLVSGIVPIMALNITTPTIQLHDAGKIRILVATSSQRVTAAPGIPTAEEAGFPEFLAAMSMGLFAPKGTAQEHIDKLDKATQSILADKDYQEILVRSGLNPARPGSAADADRHFQKERETWAPVLKDLGMSVG